MSDDVLLTRFIDDRDGEAFAGLVRRHGPVVYAVCRQRLRGARDADDAFQATFLVLVRKATSVNPRGRVGVWLCGVAWRVAAQMAARARKRPEVPAADLSDRPDPRGGEDAHAAEAVRCEVGKLPPIYREALSLCYLAGMTYEQAAAAAGCSRDAMATRVMVAKGKLRERLAAKGLGAALVVSPQVVVPASLQASAAAQATGPSPSTAGAAGLVKVLAAKVAAVVVVAVSAALGLAFLLADDRPGLKHTSPPISDEVPTVVNKLAVRPQVHELGKREVPAVLGGALAGHGTWSYDQASDVLTVTGNGKNSDIGVVVGKDGEFNKTGAIQISVGERGNRTAFGEQATINTKVFATGRTVIKVDGGAGNDNLRFGVGQEFTNGGNPGVARVELNGGSGDDLIEYWRPARAPIQIAADGGAGNDKLDFGGTLFTTVPQSQLQPGSPLLGTIRLSGGAGNDQISFDQRTAAVTGGAGADRFIASYGKAVTLSEFKSLAANDYQDAEDAFSGSGNKEDGFK